MKSQSIHVCLRQKFTEGSCPKILRSELIEIYRRSSENVGTYQYVRKSFTDYVQMRNKLLKDLKNRSVIRQYFLRANPLLSLLLLSDQSDIFDFLKTQRTAQKGGKFNLTKIMQIVFYTSIMAPIVSYSHCKSARHISKHFTGFLVESLSIFIFKK